MRLDIQAVLSPQFKARLNGTISRGLQVVDINEDTGHLILTLTDGQTVDLGKVVGDTGPRVTQAQQARAAPQERRARKVTRAHRGRKAIPAPQVKKVRRATPLLTQTLRWRSWRR